MPRDLGIFVEKVAKDESEGDKTEEDVGFHLFLVLEDKLDSVIDAHLTPRGVFKPEGMGNLVENEQNACRYLHTYKNALRGESYQLIEPEKHHQYHHYSYKHTGPGEAFSPERLYLNHQYECLGGCEGLEEIGTPIYN